MGDCGHTRLPPTANMVVDCPDCAQKWTSALPHTQSHTGLTLLGSGDVKCVQCPHTWKPKPLPSPSR